MDIPIVIASYSCNEYSSLSAMFNYHVLIKKINKNITNIAKKANASPQALLRHFSA